MSGLLGLCGAGFFPSQQLTEKASAAFEDSYIDYPPGRLIA
jgi:hypothetical protein